MSLYFSFRHKSLKHLFWYCFSFETWNFWFLSRFGYWCLSLKQNVINYKNANDCRFGVWSKTRTPYNNILLFIVLWPLVLWGQVCAFYIIAAQSLLFSFTFLRAQATFKCLNLHCPTADQQERLKSAQDSVQRWQSDRANNSSSEPGILRPTLAPLAEGLWLKVHLLMSRSSPSTPRLFYYYYYC